MTFKTLFVTAHQEWRESQVTTAGTGFQSANHLYQQENQLANHLYQQEKVDAITNLATTTASDCDSVAALTATNITLNKLASTISDLQSQGRHCIVLLLPQQ